MTVESSSRAQRILADAGTLLACAFDLEATLRRVGELTVPALAELCLLHIYTPGEDGGEIERALQVLHRYTKDTEHASGAIKLSRLPATNPIVVALRTGKTVRIHDVEDRELLEAGADQRQLGAMRGGHPRPLLTMPLRSHDRIVGTLTLVLGTSGRMHDAAEVALSEEFAQRVAWAIDGAISHATTERARRSSEEARVVLEAGNQLRDTFLASLSHELRTPMAALLLWVDILRTAKEGPMRARALNAIHVSAMAQSKLIEDLLDISRCLSGKLLMENRVVSVGTLIESALEAALPSARAKGVRLDPEYHAALGCVLGDSARLCQVLGNLLSNAIKFTDRGGLIAVRAVRVGTRVEISVIDTGCGISPDFLPQVFQPFRQAASGLPRTQVGLGLGLAIVRQLVEMHDGTVRAESTGLGQGSTFVITLPLVAAHPAVEITRSDGSRRQSVELRPRDSRSVRGLRILLLDDEPAVLEALALILRGEGCHVVKCRSVSRALMALRRGRWDAIISDIAMPGADGYSFMRRLRDLAPPGRHLPAIALTAHARAQDEVRAIEAGFDVHLPKPVEADDLVDTIANIVARYPVGFVADSVNPRRGRSPRGGRLPGQLDAPLEARLDHRALDKRLDGRLERVRLERLESGFAIPDAAPLVAPSNDAVSRSTPHVTGPGGRAKRGE